MSLDIAISVAIDGKVDGKRVLMEEIKGPDVERRAGKIYPAGRFRSDAHELSNEHNTGSPLCWKIVSRPRFTLICLLALLAVLYGIAWLAPAIGLAYSDGASLVMAVTHKSNGSPPLFPAILALFALISRQAQWLKLVPLLCTCFWLILTRRLLTKMGASRENAWFLVAITAASPTVLYLATGLFAEPLFALLMTGCLLALLDDRPLTAGLCAGLATITMTAGAALIVACLFTLVAHRRVRSAAVFACASMVFAAPWLGWTLAQGEVPVFKLYLSEQAVLLGKNAMLLAASPFTLLSGYANLYPGLLTAVALLIVLIRRRQFVPDLFFGLYCVVLMFRIQPPLHAFAPVLPLFLWILWRVARKGRFADVAKITALLLVLPALWFGASRVESAVSRGAVGAETATPDNWHEMETLFHFIRANTPASAVLLANLGPVFYLNTGRTTVRGFVPDSYASYYAPPGSLVTPDELVESIRRDRVSYVALTPDRDLPASASFHRAAAALERGGMLEPVDVPGVTGDYRLLRVRR